MTIGRMRWLGGFKCCVALVAASAFDAVRQPAAVAITINIEYSTDFGGEENPTWDENGLILISHFQAAKQIWESLLPGEGEISFDFQWDDDLGADTNGQYTPGLDEYIEINPLQFWFADPTPNDSSEFGVPTQTLYSQVLPALQASHFPATVPPGGLEVGYRAAGIATSPTQNTLSLSGQMVPADTVNGIPAGPADAFNSKDLLSTVLHEIGHALGLSGIEPGNYNILPEHVGGLSGVEVLEGGGGHLAGQGNVPYLMCESCGAPGVRRFATATDILVIAEEQDITNVKLARVGRISAGNWNNTNAWIGADVPDATQDAYISQAGAVTLDVNASVKSLNVRGGGSVDATGFQLVSTGDITFDGGAITAGAGALVKAEALHGDPATLTTAAGSTIEFNNFTRGASSATAATFNGSVKIGFGDGENLVSFNPNAIATWMIGQNLTVGTFLQPTQLVIDNGEWNIGGVLNIQRGGDVMVDGGFLDTSLQLTGGNLAATGPVTVDGALTYRGRNASNTTYTLAGGAATKFIDPPNPTIMRVVSGGGGVTFEDTSTGIPIGARAGSATFNLGGGTGDTGPGAVVSFKGNSRADDAEFVIGPGIGGESLRISNPIVIAGTGGRVTFEGNSSADTAHFSNYGGAAHGPHGSGGATHFRNDATASLAVFDNYGSTLQSYTGAVPAPGGRTEFFDTSRASLGTFNNHPGQGMGSLGAGVTIFHGSSSAASGTFYNKGGAPGSQHGGSVEFYDNATASSATFYNEHANGVSQHAGSAGNVRFYNSSTAGNATFYNQVGGGTVYFNDSSTAGDAHFFIEDTGTGTFGGHVVFNGNSRGGDSDITVRENAFSASVEFRGTSNAENAVITLVNGHQSALLVTNSASLGNANIDVGAGSSGNLMFRESATAANSTIRLRPGGGADFTGSNTTAANATFTLDGATVANGGTGYLNCSGCKGGDATFYVNAGTVFNSAGAQIGFNNGANLGTAKVVGAAATVPGAGGARINLDASSTAANATFTIGVGGYLSLAGFGEAQVGSLDIAGGAIHLGQTGLRIGALNTSNTISGQITGFFNNGNAKITKVGTGTLTLAGANTYYGLTKVDGGTLVMNGTTPGAAEVNSGAVLAGTGSFAGTVTVNAGGTLAPGDSPGKITVGALNLTSSGTLAMELAGIAAGTQYDQVVSTGAFSLAGSLVVTLANGFTPTAGDAFNLLDWGTLSGAFSSLSLPSLSGLTWDTSQLYVSGVLSVVSAGLLGDYNQNGTVDAADYTVWQDNLGSATALANDDTPGVGADDYTRWKNNFGNSAGAGSSAPGSAGGNVASVPEPVSLVHLLSFALALLALRRQR